MWCLELEMEVFSRMRSEGRFLGGLGVEPFLQVIACGKVAKLVLEVLFY